ncbi:Mitochondrial intermembrane space import and assembly protein 40 [Trapelia coarctata]|nr:Mitochondrial intermembrane space import and assembly protein 40 [Trapelia coarctata]
MFRPASRSLLERSLHTVRCAPSRRFLSTAPPHQKSRSWKSSAARWGLAAGAIYFYNTSPVFAEEPAFYPPEPPSSPAPLPTLSSLSPSSHRTPQTSPTRSASTALSPEPPTTLDPTSAPPPTGPLSETEEEASQQGAFNEETGEINWDCPCLGGMAHGPCGEEFRAAFSCFVYSTEEPKGMDCIQKFKGMQDCFREHPDVYGGELEEDEEGEGAPERSLAGGKGRDGEGEGEQRGEEERGVEGNRGEEPDTHDIGAQVAIAKGEAKSTRSTADTESQASKTPLAPAASVHEGKGDAPARTQRAKAATAQVEREHEPQGETDELMPKAAHDATAAETHK